MSTQQMWRGDSGCLYTYNVEPMPFTPPLNVDGNYIFAKQISGIWYAVYVGQGNLRNRYKAAIDEG